jgi:hypothetical protein
VAVVGLVGGRQASRETNDSQEVVVIALLPTEENVRRRRQIRRATMMPD